MDQMEESSEQPIPQTPPASEPEGLQVTPAPQRISKINKKVLLLSLLFLVVGLSLGYLFFGGGNSEKVQDLNSTPKPVATESKSKLVTYTHPLFDYTLSYTRIDGVDYLSCYSPGDEVPNDRFIMYETNANQESLCIGPRGGTVMEIYKPEEVYDCVSSEAVVSKPSTTVVDGVVAQRCERSYVGGMETDIPTYSDRVVACKIKDSTEECYALELFDKKFASLFSSILSSFKFSSSPQVQSQTEQSPRAQDTQPERQAKTCTEISYGLCITPSSGWSVEEKNIDGNQMVGIIKSFDSSFYISKEEGIGYSGSGNIYANEPRSQTMEDKFSVRIMGETYSSSIVHPVNEDTGYERYIFSFYADKLPEPVYIYSKVESLEDLEAVKEMISSIELN